MGVWILMMFTLDFARFARPEDEGYHRAITFGWLYYLLTFLVNGLIGILLVSTFDISFDELAGQESALPVSIVGLTGILGLALITITQMRINTVNLYLASTNLQSFFSRLHLNLPRTVWLVVACVIGYLLMLTNIFSYVVDALAYQGIAIVAWVGGRAGARRLPAPARPHRRQTEFRPGRIPALNPGGIWAGASRRVVGMVLKITDTHDKPVLRHVGAAADVRDRVRHLHGRHPLREAVVVRDGAPERPRARGRRRGGGPRPLPLL